MTALDEAVRDVLAKWARRGYIVPEVLPEIGDDLLALLRPREDDQ